MEWKDLPAWVSAVAAVLSMVGLFLAFRQLRLSRYIAQMQFEDGLSREYREIAGKLPKSALMGESLTEADRQKYFDEFYRYFDLSNEQIFLRMQGRVSTATWGNWCSGIRAMLHRTAFREVWEEILGFPQHGFTELARLINENFQTDPLVWPPLLTASAPNASETQTGG